MERVYPWQQLINDVAVAASGHTVGNAVHQAYQRTDLLEKKRKMMND